MLLKEYRILLPLTVEEYRIAQLYMIQVCGRRLESGDVQHARFAEEIAP